MEEQSTNANAIVTTSPEAVIFSAIFDVGADSVFRKHELMTVFNSHEPFKNEYYVFYLLAKDHTKIQVNKEFLELYLQSNMAIFMASKSINVQGYAIGDADPYASFSEYCISLFTELSKKKVTVEEFDRALAMHKMQFVNKSAIQFLEEGAIIVSEGMKVRSKILSGYADMKAHVNDGISKIDSLVQNTTRKGIVVYGVNDDEEEDDSRGLKCVANFGIPEVDKALGGIFEGDMVSVLAPSKGGKSRFATYVLHNAVVVNETPIVMWSIENGLLGWESLLRARHFAYTYNKNLVDPSKKMFIDNDMIRKGSLTGELRELERASWANLKATQRIVNLDKDFSPDTFLSTLEEAIDRIGAKLVCIDYLQLATSKDGRSNSDVVANVYKETLQFLKRKGVGGIFPAQFKQSTVTDLQRVDPEELINAELRDKAGISAEVIKTPDVNMAIYATTEDLRNGQATLLSAPSRNSATFAPVPLSIELGTCTFTSVKRAS